MGIDFNEADIKSRLNSRGFQKELILRCANLGGVLKPYKQLKEGNANDQLTHEMQKKNLVLQQKILEHEITIEKQKTEIDGLNHQVQTLKNSNLNKNLNR